MLKRIKNLFKAEPRKLLVVKRGSMTDEAIRRITDETGMVAALVDNTDDIKIVEEVKGNGKAIFISEGSEEDFKEQEKSDKGLKGIFGIGK